MNNNLRINNNTLIRDWLISFAAFLACIIPRYSGIFKIRIGINVSVFTFFVLFCWFIYAKKTRIRVTYYEVFFILWLLFTLISVTRAEAINDWAYFVVYLGTAVLWMRLLISNLNERVLENIENILLLALLFHLFLGLYETIEHVNVFELSPASNRHYGKTALTVFHNPNDYSTFVVTFFPFLLHKLLSTESKINKIVFSIGLVLAIYLLLFNGSRMAILSIIFLLALFIAYLIREERFRIPMIIVIFVGMFALIIVPQFRQLVANLFIDNSVDVGGVDRARVNLIKNGLFFIKETKGLGVGPGNLSLWFENKSIYWIGPIRLMHNWYAEILTIYGVGFFVLYMIYHIKIIIGLRRTAKIKSSFDFATCAYISFLIFTIMSISSSSNVYSEWVWMYLVLMGCIVVYYGKMRNGNNTYKAE